MCIIINSIKNLICLGDITQKGYEKKRAKLLTPFLRKEGEEEEEKEEESSISQPKPVESEVQESNVVAKEEERNGQTPAEVGATGDGAEVGVKAEQKDEGQAIAKEESSSKEQQPKPHKSGKPRSRHRQKR